MLAYVFALLKIYSVDDYFLDRSIGLGNVQLQAKFHMLMARNCMICCAQCQLIILIVKYIVIFFRSWTIKIVGEEQKKYMEKQEMDEENDKKKKTKNKGKMSIVYESASASDNTDVDDEDVDVLQESQAIDDEFVESSQSVIAPKMRKISKT